MVYILWACYAAHATCTYSESRDFTTLSQALSEGLRVKWGLRRLIVNYVKYSLVYVNRREFVAGYFEFHNNGFGCGHFTCVGLKHFCCLRNVEKIKTC